MSDPEKMLSNGNGRGELNLGIKGSSDIPAAEIDDLIKQATPLTNIMREGPAIHSDEKLTAASKEYRRLHTEIRDKAGRYIKDKYLGDNRDTVQSLSELIDQWGISRQELQSMGISLDDEGRVRLKTPDNKEAAGSFEDSEVIKALLVGMRSASNDEERAEVIRDLYRYLGLSMPVEEESGSQLMEKLRKLSRKGLLPFIVTLFLTLFAYRVADKERLSDGVIDKDKITNVEKGDNQGVIKVGQEWYYLTADDSEYGIGDVAKKMLVALGVSEDEYTDEQLYDLIKELARNNDVDVPELGVSGKYDDQKLPIGFRVHLLEAWNKAKEIAVAVKGKEGY